MVRWNSYSKAHEKYRQLNGILRHIIIIIIDCTVGEVINNKGDTVYLLQGSWDKGLNRLNTGMYK